MTNTTQTSKPSGFLPSDYTPPTKGNNYMRLKQGDNRFRIISEHPVIGHEYWNTDGKPVRLRTLPTVEPKDLRKNAGSGHWTQSIKHFWAFAVWNKEAELVQILQITQSSIQNGISALIRNEDWGHPNAYDITINREGESMETKYSIMPNPHKGLPEEALDLIEATPVRLEALFDGGDPFLDTEEAVDTFAEEEL
jgi:hypothetical protein